MWTELELFLLLMEYLLLYNLSMFQLEHMWGDPKTRLSAF